MDVRRATWLVAMGAFLAGSGCSDGVGVPPPLEVSIETSSTVLELPGTLEIVVEVRNPGIAAVVVPEWICPAPFRVQDLLGQTVGPGGIACLAIVPPATALGPGERHRYPAVWDGEGLDGALPAGPYRIVAEVSGGSDRPSVPLTVVR